MRANSHSGCPSPCNASARRFRSGHHLECRAEFTTKSRRHYQSGNSVVRTELQHRVRSTMALLRAFAKTHCQHRQARGRLCPPHASSARHFRARPGLAPPRRERQRRYFSHWRGPARSPRGARQSARHPRDVGAAFTQGHGNDDVGNARAGRQSSCEQFKTVMHLQKPVEFRHIVGAC